MTETTKTKTAKFKTRPAPDAVVAALDCSAALFDRRMNPRELLDADQQRHRERIADARAAHQATLEALKAGDALTVALDGFRIGAKSSLYAAIAAYRAARAQVQP